MVKSWLLEVWVGPPVVLHPLDNPPPGVLVLSEDLRVVRGHLHGSLSQIIDCADERLGSGVVFVVLPTVHRLPQPVVVHLDDGEELRGLLCQQVVQLSVMLRPILGNLGFTSFWVFFFLLFLSFFRARSLPASLVLMSLLTFYENSAMGMVRLERYHRWCSSVFKASSPITLSVSRNFWSFLWRLRSLMAA